MSLLFKNDKWVEYVCKNCGAKSQRHEETGKPAPGSCPRKVSAKGQRGPHVWIVNRKF